MAIVQNTSLGMEFQKVLSEDKVYLKNLLWESLQSIMKADNLSIQSTLVLVQNLLNSRMNMIPVLCRIKPGKFSKNIIKAYVCLSDESIAAHQF